jgi:hypothetical protein
MSSQPPKDFPFAEIVASCERAIRDGNYVVQKWTCGGCGRRISANNVNTVTEHGHCQHCNFVTHVKETGCNFALLVPSHAITAAEAEQILGLTPTGIQ